MGFICMTSAVKVRAALSTAISRKAILLNHISAEDTAAVVGFMANDLGKVYDGMLVRRPPPCSPTAKGMTACSCAPLSAPLLRHYRCLSLLPNCRGLSMPVRTPVCSSCAAA